ncbi:MAG: pro-sigmaK processing inhibitor BofA family protein [Clostridiales bacterium]|nr:pro-sigmaK processing inhibitor BofA family protein [Clostridiales bacterium]
MPISVDFNMVIYVTVIFVLLTLVMILKQGSLVLLKFVIKTAIGGALILAFNLVGQHLNYTVPLNLITSVLVGVLGLPGIILIALIDGFIF